MLVNKPSFYISTPSANSNTYVSMKGSSWPGHVAKHQSKNRAVSYFSVLCSGAAQSADMPALVFECPLEPDDAAVAELPATDTEPPHG